MRRQPTPRAGRGALLPAALLLAVVATGTGPTRGASAASEAGGSPGTELQDDAASSPTRPGPPADAPLQLETAIHVHTRATSSGRLSVAEIAQVARREGVDAVVYTDNLVRDHRYAPWPLRGVFEIHRREPALVAFGVEAFLEQIATVDARFPDLLLLPGVEVTPYYWWSGSLLEGRLVLHDFQRDLLVVPPAGPPDATEELISSLPAIDNPGAEGWGPGSLGELLPGLGLLLVGLGSLRAGRRKGRPLLLVLGVAAAVVGAGLLIHHFPFTEPLYQPYSPAPGWAAEQRLIDHVRQRQGVVLWSTPEVDNSGARSVGPIRVELDSPPYVDGLARTRGWDAFGGLYAHGVEAIDPGGLWDDLLLEHARGQRARAAWMVGESDFRYTGQAGKFLSEVLTVLLVPDPTREAALEALAGGDSYALRQTENEGLRLSEFTVSGASGTETSWETSWPGEEISVPAGTLLEIRVAIDSREGTPLPCRIRLVRDGRVVEEWDATAPFRRRILAPFDGETASTYYRLDVRGPRPHRLVTNPIFVRR